MTYITNVPREVLEEVEHITGTLPGKVYYSDDGEALILADEDKYIISVEPPSVILEGFNNGNCTTHSAYLYAYPPEGDSNASIDDEAVIAEPGWSTGWEC